MATDMIANPVTDQSKDMAFALRLRIEKDGKVTVINERNKRFNKTYGAELTMLRKISGCRVSDFGTDGPCARR